MRPDTIFIIFYNLKIGGVQRKIVDIVNFLVAYKKDLKIYLLLREKTPLNMANKIRNKNVRVIDSISYLKVRPPFFFPFFVFWHVVKLKPRAILAFLDIPSVSAVLSKLLFWRKTRVVISEDHYTSGVLPLQKNIGLRTLMLRLFYPLADVIFTCTKANREDLIKTYGIPSKKIKMIRNWTTFVNKKPGRAVKKFDLLYVGRFDKTKNIIFLLKGLKKIKRHKKDISLCLVGQGTEEGKLKTYVKKNKLTRNVKFIGATDKIKSFYNWSRIFVFSPIPRAEGFPLVILEAMALHVPVLTNDFAGVKEIIKDRSNGFIFYSMEDFVKKTLWLLQNPPEVKAVINQARSYVKKYHSPENIKDYLKELSLVNTVQVL